MWTCLYEITEGWYQRNAVSMCAVLFFNGWDWEMHLCLNGANGNAGWCLDGEGERGFAVQGKNIRAGWRRKIQQVFYLIPPSKHFDSSALASLASPSRLPIQEVFPEFLICPPRLKLSGSAFTAAQAVPLPEAASYPIQLITPEEESWTRADVDAAYVAEESLIVGPVKISIDLSSLGPIGVQSLHSPTKDDQDFHSTVTWAGQSYTNGMANSTIIVEKPLSDKVVAIGSYEGVLVFLGGSVNGTVNARTQAVGNSSSSSSTSAKSNGIRVGGGRGTQSCLGVPCWVLRC
ncbi:uncharacterized protein LACBIDRAFT_333209 [Laccaria bicolor S238N-H82]|uniref:Predicted protein n=1 Tax=Laccaria bicolor (strain S238N-H82 / ATCC MYA-4686) TaxID=486041 RepID=B0DV88_LACBS|nr:uncharacterized protein LACBIDRAFT_333209 [Laccaria bicolor S238N-H82]EDR01536.1 predicted protein [Laccaria bicolor S238N-H82]|eukprot:XP_001887888.1 predicted protein [Laccaria bicolor S238N-H82]